MIPELEQLALASELNLSSEEIQRISIGTSFQRSTNTLAIVFSEMEKISTSFNDYCSSS